MEDRYLKDVTIGELMAWCNSAWEHNLCGQDCPAPGTVCEVCNSLEKMDWERAVLPGISEG